MIEKKCFKCNVTKPLSEYYKHVRMADGRLNKCKTCTKNDVRIHYANNIDKYREYEKKRANLPHRVQAREEYAKTDEGRQAGNKAKKNWTEKNPIKKSASFMVNNAIRSGKIVKPQSCQFCGSNPQRLHGHHDDYAFPLVVRWLCPGCHSKWHRENGEGLNAN